MTNKFTTPAVAKDFVKSAKKAGYAIDKKPWGVTVTDLANNGATVFKTLNVRKGFVHIMFSPAYWQEQKIV